MRKFVMICLLAVPAVVLCEQSASAWCKFGCCLNFSCGGKKFCYDAGQPPCENSCCTSTPCCCPSPCCAPPCCPAPCCGAPYCAAPAAGYLPAAPSAAATARPASPIQPVDYQAQQAYWANGQQPAGYYYYYNPGFDGFNIELPSWFNGN